MNQATKKALYIVLISLGLALVFNYLFFEKLIGISVFIFNAVLVGTVFLLGLSQKLSFKKTWWLILLILFFALMPAIRDSELLVFFNVCAAFGLLVLLAHQLTGMPPFLMRLADYFVLAVFVPFRILDKALSTIAVVGQIRSNEKNRNVWLSILKGVIMALPILIIFGLLFSSADLAFSKFLKSFVDINISERTIQYSVLLAFAFAASLCFLSYIFFGKTAPSELFNGQRERKNSRSIEVMVFLGLIAALFLLFIGFQITYLFGGQANIVDAGFTYAEYARRGFFELLAVSVLTFLVLVAFEKYSGAESKRNKSFLIPALVLIAEVIIVMVSAFKRLDLYIDAYSLTAQRFYVAGFIILLFVLFIILAVKFIKLKREQFFTFGTLLSVIAFFLAVNIISPDKFIAKSNMKQFNRTGKIDVPHLGKLSADAMPWKIELYNKLEGEDKNVLRELLQKQRERLEKNINWRSWNLSRMKALGLLKKLTN